MLFIPAATCPIYGQFADDFDPQISFGSDDSCYRALNAEAYLANDYVMLMCDGACHPVRITP